MYVHIIQQKTFYNCTDYISVRSIVVPYKLYDLYDWGKVPELYGIFRPIMNMELYGT